MKPRLRIIAGRPVTVSTDNHRITAARRRFGMATGEANRLFNHELGSLWLAYPEPCLTRWGRKAEWRNARGK